MLDYLIYLMRRNEAGVQGIWNLTAIEEERFLTLYQKYKFDIESIMDTLKHQTK
jgi:hypothetical protein